MTDLRAPLAVEVTKLIAHARHRGAPPGTEQELTRILTDVVGSAKRPTVTVEEIVAEVNRLIPREGST